MPEQINDSFQRLYGNALDSDYRKLTINDRDNINSTIRYTGMTCYVDQTNTCYALIGGTDNTYWTFIWGGGGTTGGGSEFVVDGYPFTWKKGRNRTTGVINSANAMEVNDLIVDGFALYQGDYKLIKLAEYVSGNPAQIGSYNIIEYI